MGTTTTTFQELLEPVRSTLHRPGDRVSAQDIIEDQMNRADRDVEAPPDVGSQALSQVQQDMSQKESSLGGADVFGAALKRRAERSYGKDLSKMQRQFNISKPEEKFRRTAIASKNAAEIYKNEVAYQQAQLQKAADEKAERSSVLSSVLGLAGTIGGALVAGPIGVLPNLATKAAKGG